MPALKVLHVSSGNLFGGVERFLISLAESRDVASEMRSEFALFFPGRQADELHRAGATVHLLTRVRLSRPWTVWRARRSLAALIRRERYDVVVVHMAWNHIVAERAVRKTRTPLVTWVHDTPAGKSRIERLAAKRPPDFAIANSRYTLEQLPNLFPGVPAEVVYCVVPTNAIAARRIDRTATRVAMGVDDSTVVIVIACRLERWKGHGQLIDALSAMRPARPWQCWIAGGAQSEEQHAYVAELQSAVTAAGLGDRVRFLGPRDDVPTLLAAADIHCQPNSSPEPFGIAFVEALAADCAVVTTRLGAAPEILNGVGLIVPAGDRDSLSRELTRLVNDDGYRSQIARGGSDRAAEMCSPDRVLPKLEGVLRQVVAAASK